MNRTAYNNNTQSLNIPYTLTQLVIPGRQVTFETPEQQAIWYYEDFILSIMKVMDLQYITHCTDDEYQLITIHGADDMLIHIKPSKILMRWLMKQKNKANSIKTRVNVIQQASLLPNRVQHQTSNLIKNKIWKGQMMYDRWRWKEKWYDRDERYTWKMKKTEDMQKDMIYSQKMTY